ncbi:terpene synthase family protein [Streptomyces sp. NPDC093085]|uniref:terpene synthase family protein n=1 Tax=Streptomyces sp. NPDC093085 TaxID=3155068 RepID=UPI003430085A
MRIGIPALYAPFPYRRQPVYRALEEACTDWLASLNPPLDDEQRKLLASCNSSAASRVFCSDIPTELLQPFHDWAVVATFFDKVILGTPPVSRDIAKMAEIVDTVMTAMESPLGKPAGEDFFITAWKSLADRIRLHAAPSVMTRWLEGHRQFFLGHLHQQALALAGRQCDLDTYACLRRKTFWAPVVPPAMEMSRGDDLSDAYLNHPELQAMSQAAQLLWAWDNDIFSYGRDFPGCLGGPEIREGQEVNLVEIIRTTYRCDLPEAFERAVRLRNQIMVLFTRLSEEFTPHDDAVRTHIGDLGRSVSGNIAFHHAHDTDWYCCAGHTSSTRPQITLGSSITDISPPEAGDPLPWRSIGWWWELVPSVPAGRNAD